MMNQIMIIDYTRRLFWALTLLIVLVSSIVFLRNINPEAAITTGFGFFFGYIFQRSRFCFASAFRDPFMIRNTALSRAVLLTVLFTTYGFILVQLLKGDALSTAGSIYPIGLNTIAGGFIFGFGMVFTGSCVSGCLMRMGEGHLLQWLTFLGILSGATLGAWHYGWWNLHLEYFSPKLFLPDLFGWPSALILQTLLIVFLYYLASFYEKNWSMDDIKNMFSFQLHLISLKRVVRFIFSTRQISYQTGAVMLAITNALLFFFWGKPWAITAGITNLCGWFCIKLGVPVVGWSYFRENIISGNELILNNHPLLFLVLAMIAGSHFSSFIAGEFRISIPKSTKYTILSLCGGLMLGYGAIIALGCNIGGFLSGTASLSFHGWVLGFFMLIGSFVGGKIFLRFIR
jgi:uncharacterized protein